ncbi:Glucose-1-phosphate adenylyltransferase [Planctomycetales bacterium 10988]|nr:Glucose-1-phosphate adenylyltransferase [Planctomycetales bacterium 10988]
MWKTLALVLGGGRGSRLYPLTKYRSKPAVPLAGKYRLIDIPVSNCINSGVRRIYVLTQFNSVSLHRHIRQTYNFDIFSGGFVEILAAQQTTEGTAWYQGTADAVRKNLMHLDQFGVENILILSGDQLYRMDFSEMLRTHKETNADVSIAALPVDRKEASALGIMKVTDEGRIFGFVEKPQTEEELSEVLVDPGWIEKKGIQSHGRDCLASMGIYLFKRETLLDILDSTDDEDFGKQIFPRAINDYHVQSHLFDGYWEDIGTIRAFYRANLDLAKANPPFELASAEAPIYSRARFLPPTFTEGATVKRSLIADGCTIGEGSVIENSVVGLRCRIGRNVTIRNSIIMGSDYYEPSSSLEEVNEGKLPAIGIGDGCFIDGAIVDKNARLGSSVHIRNFEKVENADEVDGSDMIMIRDGIVVVNKNATIADGTHV